MCLLKSLFFFAVFVFARVAVIILLLFRLLKTGWVSSNLPDITFRSTSGLNTLMKINASTRYDSVMRLEAAADAQRAGSPRPLREVGDQVEVGGVGGGGGSWFWDGKTRTSLGGSVISLTGRRNETREAKACFCCCCCCCEGEITAGLCKCQKVMKNASSGQETRRFSGVSALLAGSEEPN